MHVLKVGELFHPERRQWPETPTLQLSQEHGVQLVLLFARPSAAEVAAVRSGAVKFAWIDSDHTGILAFRFAGGIPWSDVPYTPHRERPEAGTPGEIAVPAGQHLRVMVVLVDAATGVVAAIRMTTWPAAFAAVVRRSVDRMLANPFSAQAADQGLDALYARYPKTDDLVRDRADMTCTGGTPDSSPGTGPDASPPTRPDPTDLPASRSPAAVIEAMLGGAAGRTRSYPAPLPEPLQPWYVYLADAGHNILVAVEQLYQPGAPPQEFLVPAPVKAVLRGWREHDGYILADLPYDPQLGLVTDEDDDEY